MSHWSNILKTSSGSRKAIEEHRDYLKTAINTRIVLCIALLSGIGIGLFSSGMISLIIPMSLLLLAVHNYLKYGNGMEMILRELGVEHVMADNGVKDSKLIDHIENTSEKSKNYFQRGDKILHLSIFLVIFLLFVFGFFKLFPWLLSDLGAYYFDVLF